MPIKASYNSWGETTFKSTAVRAAIDFAIENGADVINMSISDKGADPGTSTDFDMVTKEDAQKAVFVAAAGNNSTASSTVGSAKGKWYYPAANKHVIGVMNYAEENGKNPLCRLRTSATSTIFVLPATRFSVRTEKATKATNP